jgi:NAD(P)-dependent dehydrogenase (short-subunit alcohol dehydrogenase family)
MMSGSLEKRAAIVTGAGNIEAPTDVESIGNGRASAMLYAAEGASVLAVDLNKDAAEETRNRIIGQGGTCVALTADVSDARACKEMVRECIERFGRIDILHNNVGIMQPKAGGITEVEEAVWDQVMNVNLKSVFYAARAAIPQMKKQGSGCIINISSLASRMHGMSQTFTYSVSKAAQNALTRCMAIELAPQGIRVNGIMPGMMDTPVIYETLPQFFNNDIEAMRKQRNEKVPMKRMGTAWDVARAALFLVSDDAKYITGQILGVDGGMGAMFS